MRGSILDERYVIHDQLGSGTSCHVYRAQDERLGRAVAVKLMHRAADRDAARRFEREARMAAAFRHDDAIEVFAVGEHAGQPYIVMELVEAPTFGAWLAAERPVGPERIAAMGAQLADVLAAAHAQGIVHRDVKPANVFVEAGPRVRLADFGLAFAVDPSHATLGRLTVQGVTLGTPFYMSPEQIEDRAITGAADVYALSAMLYEALAGRPPFRGGSIPAILAGHLYLPPIPFDELDLAAPVPPHIARVVLEGLGKRAEQRPDAAAFARRLREGPVRREHERRDAQTSPPTALSLHVWSEDPELRALLVGAGVHVARPADVEVVVADDVPSTAPASPTLLALRSPTPAAITRAIRAGYAGATRWPGELASLLRLLARFGRRRDITGG